MKNETLIRGGCFSSQSSGGNRFCKKSTVYKEKFNFPPCRQIKPLYLLLPPHICKTNQKAHEASAQQVVWTEVLSCLSNFLMRQERGEMKQHFLMLPLDVHLWERQRMNSLNESMELVHLAIHSLLLSSYLSFGILLFNKATSNSAGLRDTPIQAGTDCWRHRGWRTKGIFWVGYPHAWCTACVQPVCWDRWREECLQKNACKLGVCCN